MADSLEGLGGYCRRDAPPQTPQVLGYLQQPHRQLFDINLQVSLQPEGGKSTVVGRTNYQQLCAPVHHSHI